MCYNFITILKKFCVQILCLDVRVALKNEKSLEIYKNNIC